MRPSRTCDSHLLVQHLDHVERWVAAAGGPQLGERQGAGGQVDAKLDGEAALSKALDG
jgi:hypothetical protein